MEFDSDSKAQINELRAVTTLMIAMYDSITPGIEKWISRTYPPGTLEGNAWTQLKKIEPKIREVRRRLNSAESLTPEDTDFLKEALSLMENCSSILKEMGPQ